MRTVCITGLGSGFAPFASGTWGSLFASIIYAALWCIFAHISVPRFVIEVATVASIAEDPRSQRCFAPTENVVLPPSRGSIRRVVPSCRWTTIALQGPARGPHVTVAVRP